MERSTNCPRSWRERLALRIAPWLAADYDERIGRMMEAHIREHEALMEKAGGHRFLGYEPPLDDEESR